jgi:hypothetical protein
VLFSTSIKNLKKIFLFPTILLPLPSQSENGC